MSESSERKLQGVAEFTFVRELGRGGLGTVYLARQEGLDRDVAVKVLKDERAADEAFVARFHREAKAAASFQHPHVVAVLGAGSDAETGDHYIAFEYLAGGTLAAMVAQDPLEERRALEITRDIAEALSALSVRGLIHRDVKPENILFAEDGTPKLADLGLVRISDPDLTQLTQPGSIMGTPHFMAPEQALGSDALDHRVDQYALGLCLWHMLSGRLPFDSGGGADALTIIKRRTERSPRDIRELRGELSEATGIVLGRMTQRKSKDRYPDFDALLEDLDAALAGLDAAAPAPNPPAPPPADLVAAAETIPPRPPQLAREPSHPKSLVFLAALMLLPLLGLLSVIFGGAESGPTTTRRGASDTDPPAVNHPLAPDASAPDAPNAPGPPAVDAPPPTDPGAILPRPGSLGAGRVSALSQAFFRDVPLGEDLLANWLREDGWRQLEQTRRFLGSMQAVQRALREDLPWEQRRPDLERLSALVEEQRLAVPLKGSLGAIVDQELGYWAAYAKAAVLLRQSISDPRTRAPALELLATISAERGAEQDARFFLGLLDRVDHHTRWVRVERERERVGERLQRVPELLRTAVGRGLGGEGHAVRLVLSKLLSDGQACLVAAFLESAPQLAESELVRSRLHEVPLGASRKDMPGWGVALLLEGPLTGDQELEIGVTTHGGLYERLTLRADRVDVVGEEAAVVWGKAGVVVVESRPQDTLLRLSAEPADFFTQGRERAEGHVRISVRTRGITISRLFLLRVPQRSDTLYRSAPSDREGAEIR